MVFWPMATVPLFYFYWKPIFFQKHNKKLFDMCNVGDQYALGYNLNQAKRETQCSNSATPFWTPKTFDSIPIQSFIENPLSQILFFNVLL